MKESGQIGPYDAIRVQIPTTDGASARHQRLKQFFVKNNFTDDLILNASFDQLNNVCSDGEETDEDRVSGDKDDDDDEDSELQQSKPIKHSISFGSFDYRSSGKYRSRRKPTAGGGGGGGGYVRNVAHMSMCYLPPFSVGTLTTDQRIVEHLDQNRAQSPFNRTLLYEMDNRFVDDIIEHATMVWRKDLLSAYRTQWSCVGRLRAEIVRLRDLLQKRDSHCEQLRKENIQLKNALMHQSEYIFKTFPPD